MIDMEERCIYAVDVLRAYLKTDLAFERNGSGFKLIYRDQVLSFESTEQFIGFAEGIVFVGNNFKI